MTIVIHSMKVSTSSCEMSVKRPIKARVRLNSTCLSFIGPVLRVTVPVVSKFVRSIKVLPSQACEGENALYNIHSIHHNFLFARTISRVFIVLVAHLNLELISLI